MHSAFCLPEREVQTIHYRHYKTKKCGGKNRDRRRPTIGAAISHHASRFTSPNAFLCANVIGIFSAANSPSNVISFGGGLERRGIDWREAAEISSSGKAHGKLLLLPGGTAASKS